MESLLIAAAIGVAVFLDPFGSYLPSPFISLALDGAVAGYVGNMVTKKTTTGGGSGFAGFAGGWDMGPYIAMMGAAAGIVAAFISPDPMMRGLVAAGVYYIIPMVTKIV